MARSHGVNRYARQQMDAVKALPPTENTRKLKVVWIYPPCRCDKLPYPHYHRGQKFSEEEYE